MNVRDQTIGQRFIVAGLAAQAVAIVAIKMMSHPSPLGAGAAVLAVCGTVSYMTGLAYYARAKGHHRAWCILGLFSLLGLTVILALPDLD